MPSGNSLNKIEDWGFEQDAFAEGWSNDVGVWFLGKAPLSWSRFAVGIGFLLIDGHKRMVGKSNQTL